MRALVTGAGGFVGANLVRHLLRLGDAPIAIVRPGGEEWRLVDLGDEVETIAIDLRDPEATSRLVRQAAPAAIFHLAAHGAYSWETDLDAMLAVNVRCTQTLLEVARDLSIPLVSAGTSSEYGYRDSPPTEQDRIEPNSHYAITKAAGTHLCRLAAKTDEVHAVVLRLYSVYGPWENPGRLMPTLVGAAMNGGWPPLVDREIARDFVWAGDACDAFIRAAGLRCDAGAVFNVASGVQTTLGQLVDVVAERFAVAQSPLWGSMPARRWDTTTWVGDPRSTTAHLGWSASTPLQQGLGEVAEWFEQHPKLRERYG